MSNKASLGDLKRTALKELDAATSLSALFLVEKRYLGYKGRLTD